MIGRPFARLLSRMQFLHRAIGRWRSKPRPRYALALAGGGVIGGMYEVGALAALEERLNGSGRGFDVYVGCSAGSVVASLLAGGVRAREIYQILEQDLPDPGRGECRAEFLISRPIGLDDPLGNYTIARDGAGLVLRLARLADRQETA